MPDIRDPNTAKAIASAYMANGRKKEQALVDVGYSKTYARCGKGAQLHARTEVKQAILEAEVKYAEENGYSIAQAQAEYDEVRRLAMAINQPAAAATAITGKARLYGMDKDAQVKTDQDIELDKAQAEQARKVTEVIYGPKLHADVPPDSSGRPPVPEQEQSEAKAG